MSGYSDLIVSQGATYYWKLDESSGGAADSVGGLNLSVTGSPVYNQLGASGTAILFPAGGDGMVSASTAAMNFVSGNNFSYSFWVRFSSIIVPAGIISKRLNSTTNRHFGAFLNTPGTTLYFDLGNNQARWDTGWSASTGQWYHIAFTYEAATSRFTFYLNGAMNATTTSFTPTNSSTSTPFYIGYLGGSTSSATRGIIDEVAVFTNKLLSAAEVAAQYNTAYPFWRVFDGTGWKDADRKIL